MPEPAATQHFPLPPEEAEALRAEHYNATITHLRRIHDDLMVLRVRPDGETPTWKAGQYIVLGLGYWEPRVAGVERENVDDEHLRRLVKRPYSLSCPLLDEEGRLVRPGSERDLELYIVLVRESPLRPPRLTPRLFHLEEGDRLFMDSEAHGDYTLGRVEADDDIVFAGTGVGEAPHNAMVAELLARGHEGSIACVTCVRRRGDLAYLDAHRRLEERFANYHYIALTTREPENLDPDHPGYLGKRYLQEYFDGGEFRKDTGIRLEPGNLHVFLCGNPAMIGVPHHTHDPAKRYPEPRGMVEILEKRGLDIDRPHHRGHIHFERYW